MRYFLLIAPVLWLSTAAPALAQVTVDLHALDALPHLPGALPRRPPEPRRPAPPSVAAASRPGAAAAPAVTARKSPAAASPAKPVASAVVATPQPSVAPSQSAAAPHPPAPSTPPPPAATMSAAPPPVASLAPIQAPAPEPHAAPPAPPVSASATTTAATTKSGLQLIFTKGQSDLSPASVASIRQLAQAAPTADATTFNVLAYASGDPDDPSVARRTSLSRAIAVRDALMADGVPSTRIYLRALGAQSGSGTPADRVDIDVMGTNATPAAAQK